MIHTTRPPLVQHQPHNSQNYPPLANQIAERGWKGGMFVTQENKDPYLVYFNPAIRASTRHLFAREATWGEHWSSCRNQIVRFDIGGPTGMDLVNRKVVAFDRLHPHESWEDPRLFEHDGAWHLGVAAWYPYTMGREYRVNQCYARLDANDDAGPRVSPVYGRNGRDIFWQYGTEKNWGWFSHDGRIHFVYQVRPHVVVDGDTVHTQNSEMLWTLGELRGGSAPIRMGDEYLAFFHSSIPWRSIPKYGMRRRYFMGAYCFDAKPPFKPTRYTPQYLLAGSENDITIPGSPAVVFPCGAAHLGDGQILVTYGSNDATCGWVTIPIDDLYRHMIPC